jgi:hypothetical protein
VKLLFRFSVMRFSAAGVENGQNQEDGQTIRYQLASGEVREVLKTMYPFYPHSRRLSALSYRKVRSQ